MYGPLKQHTFHSSLLNLDFSSTSTATFAPTNKGLVSFIFSGSPSITLEKLNGKNYMDWQAAVEIWYLGQDLSDHLTTKAYNIAEHNPDPSKHNPDPSTIPPISN
ncbi:hypothetical protein Lal_00012717 [Lupinus albus]|nr:hypothetical protein Lal_00012717 [Lupinus albus]